MRYIIIGNLMNESLSFRTILTKVTFFTTSVASLILDPICFIFGFLFDTSTLAHEPLKCHFEAFIALSRDSKFFAKTEPSDLSN
jgi:hypothetical protein